MSKRPNVLLILNDDMGFSDVGCYGGEIDTPNIDKLAEKGVRFTHFYNTARCAPSRASLMTGLHPHQTGIGILTYDDGPEGYEGNLNNKCVTIAEVLKDQGYKTYLAGKWHLARETTKVNETWPTRRGFDRFFGTITGSGSYFEPHTLTRQEEGIDPETLPDDFYYTDAITDAAVNFLNDHTSQHPDKPFFQYVAYTAPHFPLHAPEEQIAKYKGRFDKGWDVLRKERIKRMVEMGIIDKQWQLSERDPGQPPWDKAENKEWLLRCMEVYAAQLDRMDQGIGRIIDTLEKNGQIDNTIIIFLADNGGSAEIIKPHPVPGVDLIPRPYTRKGKPVILGNHPDVAPGPDNTYQTYGVAWANMSNTPFRLYKSWVHEGGISTPLIISWPKGIKNPGSLRHTPGQLVDIMATVLDFTGAAYPETHKNNRILPMEGQSLVPALSCEAAERDGCLYWEHQGNAAIRKGIWKLVKQYPNEWELYDMTKDRTELHNLAGQYPEIVADLKAEYEVWAKRCRVISRDKILSIPGRKTVPNEYFGWLR